jgi:large subunit ribosomal protein L23
MAETFLIKKPLITEKATDLNKYGKYVFMVQSAATKPEIKKAVKELYHVDVVTVNVIRRPAKKKRFRNIISKKGAYKKAIVTLKAGQKIDLV